MGTALSPGPSMASLGQALAGAAAGWPRGLATRTAAVAANRRVATIRPEASGIGLAPTLVLQSGTSPPSVCTSLDGGTKGPRSERTSWVILEREGSTILPMISTEVLARVVDEAAEPELARKAIARIGERPTGRALLARPDIAPAAARLLGFSTSAADFFSAHPEELEALADLRRRTLEELVGECTSSVAAVGPSAGLRRFRRRAGYRVAARDLAGAPVDEVMEDLTAVAEACLRVAVLSVDGH